MSLSSRCLFTGSSFREIFLLLLVKVLHGFVGLVTVEQDVAVNVVTAEEHLDLGVAEVAPAEDKLFQ